MSTTLFRTVVSCDIFVSFTRDMADWAGAIDDYAARFCLDYGVKLKIRNFRDIDTESVDASRGWQDLVGSPTSLAASLCFVLIGERVGTELPSDSPLRDSTARRLSAANIDWARVPGVHEKLGLLAVASG